MLGDLPPSAQRVLARANRISLPRGCAAPLRHTRLRQALCHAATVRATYRALAPAAQAALHQLRTQRGGISPQALMRAYGPVRSWRQLAADPRPQTLSEQLVLLGWLLPRPAAPRHPPRYVLPPELRRWLPRPLTIPSVSAPPLAVAPAPLPLAVRGAVTLLLACAERPLGLTPAGQVTRAALRRLEPRLAPLAPAACAALVAWLVPLLAALDVISRQPGAGTLTLAGQRFLALPADQQRGLLYRAWIAHPDPDAWLDRLLIDRRGIDWPLLRRRLCAWVAALPVGQRSTPAALYPALVTTLGPLADAQTHGFRRVDRAPWQPRRAATIFEAAVRGPLYWLGLVDWQPALDTGQAVADGWPAPDAYVFRLPWEEAAALGAPADAAGPAGALGAAMVPDDQVDTTARGVSLAPGSTATPAWRYGAAGQLLVPHTAGAAAALRLLPFVDWAGTSSTTTTYQLTVASLARAIGEGRSLDTLWALLAAQAGPLPTGWRSGLDAPAPRLRVVQAAVLIAEQPTQLEQACRARSVRRHIAQRLAPGIAFVQAHHLPQLARALQRQAIPCLMPPATVPVTASVASLSPGDQAALWLACVFYRQFAPADAPLLPDALLEAQLRAALPPALRAAAEAAIARLRPPPPMVPPPPATPGPPPTLHRLRQALARQRPVELTYYTAGRDAWSQRTVRPLALEQRGDAWYLRAYCAVRDAERTFRVDRIGAMTMA